MDTPPPPPSQPSSSAPPPVIHQTTYALPSNYAFNQLSIANGPGVFTILDEPEPEDAEISSINTPRNIAHAEAKLREDQARRAARKAAKKAAEKRSSSSSSSASSPSRSRATSQY